MNTWLVPAALALDLLLGDPRRWPHPVVWIGRLVEGLEAPARRTVADRRTAGILLVFLTLAGSGLAAWAVLALAEALHPWLGALAGIWLAYTTLALRSLHRESAEVVRQAEQGRLEEARQALALIVGRDTAALDAEGIYRASIETVAENTSDAVVGPLFYLFLGGPVLGVLYKAANTLDSMVGYRTDRYREFGWAAARLDDLLNLIPARLTAALIVVAAFPLGLNPWNGLRCMMRDARKPASPNAGYPEAAAAGALGIQLGGPAVYFGEPVTKSTLGDADRPVSAEAYRAMVRLMYLSSFLALGVGVLAIWLCA